MKDANIEVTSGEIGKSGTLIYGGIITGEEYNPNLRGSKLLRVMDQMRRSDATVRQSLAAIKELIKAAEFPVDSVSEEKIDVEQADLARHCLQERVQWSKFLGEALTALEFGFSVFEMVFEPIQLNGKTYIGLTKLAFRKQTSIFKWETDDAQPGITQLTGDGTKVSIPIVKLLRFTINQEGDNYEGISILRTAYKHWSMKEKLERIDVVGHERHATGVVDITYSKGVTEDDKKEARKAARNMRANEESYVDHNENVVMQFMDMKANSLRDITPSIERHDRQILRNVLAQFLELGGSSAGSRATSEDHSRLFEKAVATLARELVEVVNDVAVKTLIDLNFSDVAEYPKVRATSISDDNIPMISEAIRLFTEAGAFHARPSDENTVRKMTGFKQVPEEELEEDFAGETDDDIKDDPIKEAAVVELKALRASVESALYANPRSLTGSINSRDFPNLYDGTGVNPDDLGCIMLDLEPMTVMEHLPDDYTADLIDTTDRHDHAMGAVAEHEPHVTLLYGLLENGNVWKDKVDQVLDGWDLSQVEIEEVGYFETPDSFAVIGHIKTTPELVDGHDRLTLLPHIQTFSEYKPHVTLAYVSKDADIDDWVDLLGTQYNGKTIKTTGINYGDLPDAKAA